MFNYIGFCSFFSFVKIILDAKLRNYFEFSFNQCQVQQLSVVREGTIYIHTLTYIYVYIDVHSTMILRHRCFSQLILQLINYQTFDYRLFQFVFNSNHVQQLLIKEEPIYMYIQYVHLSQFSNKVICSCCQITLTV